MSFWSKLGKIGLIGGAGLATALTGGAASPLLATAVGAGTGAATGAMGGGGWKGALMGAGLGAATGGIGGGAAGSAASGVKMGASGAVSSLLKDPNTYASIAGALGRTANGAAQGRAAGRVQEAGINNNQDALKLRAAQMMEEALQGRAGLDLKQRQFALEAPQARAKTSVHGDVLAGVQDFKVNGPIVHTHGNIPQITGGLRPSLLSDNTRQLGGLMSRDALLQQMQGDKFTAMPAPNIPNITPTPQASGADSFLNILGGVGAGAEALSPFLPRPNPYQVKRPPQQPYNFEHDWQTEGAG